MIIYKRSSAFLSFPRKRESSNYGCPLKVCGHDTNWRVQHFKTL